MEFFILVIIIFSVFGWIRKQEETRKKEQTRRYQQAQTDLFEQFRQNNPPFPFEYRANDAEGAIKQDSPDMEGRADTVEGTQGQSELAGNGDACAFDEKNVYSGQSLGAVDTEGYRTGEKRAVHYGHTPIPQAEPRKRTRSPIMEAFIFSEVIGKPKAYKNNIR